MAQRNLSVPFFLQGTKALVQALLEGSITPASSHSSIWRRRSCSCRGLSGRTRSRTGLAPGSSCMWNLTALVLPKSVSLVEMADQPSRNICITLSAAAGSSTRMGFSDSFNWSMMN